MFKLKKLSKEQLKSEWRRHAGEEDAYHHCKSLLKTESVEEIRQHINIEINLSKQRRELIDKQLDEIIEQEAK